MGVGDEVAQLHPLQGGRVGRRQHDRRRHPGLERLLPARGAQAPLVAGLQSREAELGVRRRQVVADRGREGQELRGDPGADRVHAHVLGAGVAAAVAVEAGQRVEVAGLELFAEDVLCHGPFHHGAGAALEPLLGYGPRPPRSGPASGAALIAVDPGEGVDRRPRQPAWGRHRAAEHHQGGDRNGVGDAEERAHVVLATHRHRRHHPAEAFGAGGEEQAPHEGVDGGAAGERVARQVAVHGGRARAGRRGRAAGRARCRASRRSRAWRHPPRRSAPRRRLAAASASRSVTGAQGTRPADTMARYSYHPLR